jgi:DNA-binding MarR family transcriptional regulator
MSRRRTRGPGAPEATAQRLANLFSVFAPAFLKWQYGGILVEGMTYPRMQVIHELSEDSPQIMSALGTKLGVTARTMTVLVDGLEREGFATRVPHPEDRRATLVELTDKGHAAHRAIYHAHAARAAALFQQLDAGDRDRLVHIMRSLLAALAATAAAEGRPITVDLETLRLDG